MGVALDARAIQGIFVAREKFANVDGGSLANISKVLSKPAIHGATALLEQHLEKGGFGVQL